MKSTAEDISIHEIDESLDERSSLLCMMTDEQRIDINIRDSVITGKFMHIIEQKIFYYKLK